MITVFTKKLPVQISSQIEEQYDKFLPIFKKYTESDNDKYYLEVRNNYDTSCFILALAIFYKSLIVPLREGGSCLNDFKKQGQEDIISIQIGRYLFSKNDSRQIQNMNYEFQEILNKHKIPEHILLFSDIKNFARSLNVFFLSNKYGKKKNTF